MFPLLIGNDIIIISWRDRDYFNISLPDYLFKNIYK